MATSQAASKTTSRSKSGTNSRSAATSKSTGRSNSNGTAKRASSSRSNARSEQMENSEFHQMFVDELKDIYWAEKALTKALPKMKKAATSEELQDAFEKHAEETQTHVQTLEQIFELLGQKAQAKKCDAMEGLISEAQSIIEDTEGGSMVRDAALILAAQKVEHYEIATYGTLRVFAENMGHTDVMELLEQTLENEKATDVALTEIATSTINEEASEE
ncbi:Ferritin-like metal-binding protein YciE [Chitinophaga jiangningensis]|uniref:Ferritin-like metal-binding protein YciE n=1 Tax=Chitinophaga jiangningensis TaxID=1419482 RepID=A0A1M6Z086_9BACT|nr:ferritin-like domain-containing protein [Chitinophaga jiangningensis]SHL23790.1 Ferritin-like metal-binding protein YciE [Chitinophaga jiangningensis]